MHRRKAVRRPPGETPALPTSVKVILPPRDRRFTWKQRLLTVIPIVLLVAGAWHLHQRLGGTAGEDGQDEELQEVVIDIEPPPPEPEPEPEPATEAEPEADLPDLLGETDGPAGPAASLSLDLALGTGSDGLAIAGAGVRAAAGGQRAAFEPGQVDKAPEAAQEFPPEMPRRAMAQGISGSFVATFVVNANGRVESIEISGGPQGYGFEEAIRKSLQRRRYKPATAGGVPVPVKIRQPFEFRLE